MAAFSIGSRLLLALSDCEQVDLVGVKKALTSAKRLYSGIGLIGRK